MLKRDRSKKKAAFEADMLDAELDGPVPSSSASADPSASHAHPSASGLPWEGSDRDYTYQEVFLSLLG